MRKYLLLLILLLIIGAFFWMRRAPEGTSGSKIVGLREKQPGESINEYVRSQMKFCFDYENSNLCYFEMSKLFLAQFPLGEILRAFDEEQDVTEVFTRCHTVNHYLGREAFKKAGSIAGAFGECTDSCTSGCYHGAVEGYFEENGLSFASPSDEELKNQVLRACDVKDTVQPKFLRDCYHGLGHAVMLATENDLPRTLRLCDSLETYGKAAVEPCYAGAFMENFASSSTIGHTTTFIKKEDPFYPCNILEERYLKECYRRQAFYFLDITGRDWEKTVGLCRKIHTDFRDLCIFQVSENQAGFVQESELVRKRCEALGEAGLEGACVAGGVSALSEKYRGEPEVMLEFCAGVTERNKKSCYGQVGMSGSNWGVNPEKLETVCKDLPEPYFDWCRNREVKDYRE